MENWNVKPLEIVSTMNGRIGWQGLKQSEFTQNPDEPFLITGMNFKDGIIRWDEVYHIPEKRYDEAKNIQLKRNDILMTKDGTIGKLLFIDNIPYPNKASLNSHLLLFRPIAGQYFPKFLFYQLQSKPFLEHVEQNKSGSTFFGITEKAIGEYKAFLPPIPEQQAIAETLSNIDELINHLDLLIEKKKNIKQGTIQELLARKRRLKGFNKNWKIHRLEDTFTLKARIGWQGLTTSEYLNIGNYFLVTGTDFNRGEIDWEKCHYIEEKRYSQDPNIQLKENDVLITKDGTIGKIAFVERLPKPATLNSGVFVIRPKFKEFEPLFFYYILNSGYFKDFLNRLSAGSTISHIYQKDFINFEFPIPPTKEEQIEISKILHDMDNVIKEIEKKRDKYVMIKNGMMQKLLIGEIRLK